MESLEKRLQATERKPVNSPVTLQSADGNIEVRFRAHVQADGRFYTGPLSTADTFVMRRVRPMLEGKMYRFYSFLIVLDFGSGTTALYDAYLDARPRSWAGVRLGKFKPPVGLERLQVDSELVFAERGLTSDLIPQRDVGATFFGELWDGAAAYQTSLTNGVADGAIGDTAGSGAKEGALRFFVTPFKAASDSVWRGLGAGVAGTYTNNNTALPTFKTSSGQQTFFTYNNVAAAAGERTRLVPQLNYYWRSLGFFAEYAQTTQTTRLASGLKRHLTNQAWQAAASVVLTGEEETYRSVTPKRNFDPDMGTWGAFGLAARFHQLEVDPDAFSYGFANPASSARKATGYTAGVNWYLNKAVKLTTDFEETWFSGGAPNGNRSIERVVLTRAQLAF